jgi:heptosyltransferase I
MPERWAQVCHLLWNEFGLQPVLVGGRSPRELAAEAIILRDAPMAHSALGSGLRKLAAILDGAAVALSPDTGPLHLAVGLRTPVIGLMGYTNPKRVGPYDFSRDLLIDAYGDPGEDYPLDMTYRQDRMGHRRDVHAMLVRWKERYAAQRSLSANAPGLARGRVIRARRGATAKAVAFDLGQQRDHATSGNP